MKLRGMVAVVTGGATGIGKAISLALSHQGAAVVVNYAHSRADAELLVRTIESMEGQAAAVRADVSIDAEARALIDSAANRYGRLDVLVNNAGFTKRVPHREMDGLTDELLDRVLGVNLLGPLHCSRAAIPHMLKVGGGSIVNITSVASLTGAGSSMIYAASKAGLSSLTKSLARAFAPEIRVNAVAPGFVATGFGDWPAGTAEAMEEETPIGRLIGVDDVAAAVIYLLTDGTGLTGAEIVVDGGVISLGKRS